jgi:hypothetical protein
MRFLPDIKEATIRVTRDEIEEFFANQCGSRRRVYHIRNE